MELNKSQSLRNSKWNSLLFYSLLLGGLLPLLLLIVGVKSGMSENRNLSNKKVIMITQEDNGQVMELKKGETFRIELEELGSAGYQWYLEKLDQEYLELVSKETRGLNEGMIGAPVMAIWLLKAKKIGQAEIVMDHYRHWEGKDRASKHFSIRLLIK
jgi:predicted secreted protein